jgi:2-desacetyl-2-hydroxyethyl bacteriochlorophyllide A dehydrogenase
VLAVVYPQPNRYELRDVPVLEPAPGQVLLKVMATTLCATDFKVFAGHFPGTRFPHTPGHEFAGQVVGVGAGVRGFEPGERVGVEVHVGCGGCARCLEGLYTLCEHYGQVERGHAHIGFTVPGGLAECAAVPARALHQLPDTLSWDEGAFADNIGVALWAVERSALQAGERVAVVGPGAFGALVVQIAAALGASRIAMVGTRAERMDLVRQLNVVDDFVDSSTCDPAAELRRRWGEGADVVVEFAGTESAARQAIQLARRGGRVVLAGATGPGRELKELDLSTIVRGHLDIYGSLANPKGVSARGLALMARGSVNVKPLITHHFPLTDFQNAWETFRERRGGAIRVMLRPWD